MLAVCATLRWWRAVGPERAAEYMRDTLAAGVAALLTRWQTHTLLPAHLCSNMALVRLPTDALPRDGSTPLPASAPLEDLLGRKPPALDGPATSADAKAWQDWLHFAAAVEVPVKCIQGHLYCRVSAHIYNETGDYEKLADAVARALGWTSA